MSELYLPDFSEILAVSHSRGAESEAPELWDDLVALYPIAAGGGIIAEDMSGFEHNGTLTNGPTWVMTEKGSALDFDGGNQYGDIPHSSRFEGLVNSSIGCWFRVDSTPTNTLQMLMSKYDQNLALENRGWYFALFDANGDGDAQLRMTFSDGVNSDVLQGTISVVDGKWYQAAGVRQAGKFSLFLNGKLDISASGLITGASVATNRSQLIGARWNIANTNRHFDGQLSLCGFWPRAITPSEIQQLHQDQYVMLRLRTKPHPTAVAPAAGTTNPFTMGAVNLLHGKLGA